MITVEEIFNAYYDCRRNKRGSQEALKFEVDLERNLLELLSEINEKRYCVGQSKVFVIEKPVPREVFAASFRDRVVHHLLLSLIGDVVEKRFVYDCYACRKGKGTHLGIARLQSALDSHPDGWVLKMDFRNFFMSIDKRLLFSRLACYLQDKLDFDRYSIVEGLLFEIIFNDPRIDCAFLCPREKWNILAPEKSLFNAKPGKGLPIGNLTSQVFANFYLSYLDHFVKHDLGIRRYGRYVDDFYLVHDDKSYLIECRNRIEAFSRDFLLLDVNPRKTYLQRVDKGVKFLGVSLCVSHTNMSKRTVRNFRTVIDRYNHLNSDHRLSGAELKSLVSSVNSYLGILSHYDTFHLRKAMIEALDERILKRLVVDCSYRKVRL